jgi:hypothetical protein
VYINGIPVYGAQCQSVHFGRRRTGKNSLFKAAASLGTIAWGEIYRMEIRYQTFIADYDARKQVSPILGLAKDGIILYAFSRIMGCSFLGRRIRSGLIGPSAMLASAIKASMAKTGT